MSSALPNGTEPLTPHLDSSVCFSSSQQDLALRQCQACLELFASHKASAGPVAAPLCYWCLTAIPAGIPASQALRDSSPCLGSSRGPGCGCGAGLAPTLPQESLCFPALCDFPVTAVCLPQIRLRCQKGIPPSLRGRAWQYLSGSKVKLEQNMGKFDVSPAGNPPAPPGRGQCWGASCSGLGVC